MKTPNTTFVFSAYQFDIKTGRAAFHYKVKISDTEVLEFTDVLQFPVSDRSLVNVGMRELTPFLQNLHLMLGISYWKMYCSKNIEIEAFEISKEQADFWKTVYTKGLGEFFFTNNIDFRGLVQFPYSQTKEVVPVHVETDGTSVLPFGGGKDSIVSAHILKDLQKEFIISRVNTSSIQDAVIKKLEEDSFIIGRSLDPKMIQMSKEGKVYSGHVPATAAYIFINLFAAALYGYSYIVMSNERSASYGNVEYLGDMVNHQWSKSLEFEQLARTYIETYISPDIIPFSILRPYYEIEITRRFAEHPEYFSEFSSCNRNFKIENPQTGTLWCGSCPKCSFVFAMLAAFLPKESVVRIFGKNLFSDITLLPLYRSLLGVEEYKPFECVGTPEETKVAFYKSSESGEYNNDAVMRMFNTDVKPELNNTVEKLEKSVFEVGDMNTIPEGFS